MDYKTACRFLIDQATATEGQPDSLLSRLKQGKPPVPGQVTSILLALKLVFEATRQASSLDRELVYALYLLATESQQWFEAGRRARVDWPLLLGEDIKRIGTAVKSIFAGIWHKVY